MTPTPRFRTLSLRAAQVALASGLIAGVGVAAAALTLPADAFPASSSPRPVAAASVEAQTAAAPVAVPRASRSRALAPKHTPMMQVVRTVAVGASFSGEASWYGGSFVGRSTASGERFDTNAYTAASRTLPFGTHLRVCHAGCVVVRVNDRGPYVGGRVLDLSRAAAHAIGFDGVAQVTATPVDQRMVSVVDTAALARLQAQERHAALVARSHELRALQLARAAAAVQAASAPAPKAPEPPRVPGAVAGGAIALGSAGLLRRVRAL